MTTIERVIGASPPAEAGLPVYDTWKVWRDAMLYVDATGAIVSGGDVLVLGDAANGGRRFTELGMDATAELDDSTFGRPVLDTTGISSADVQGYGVPMTYVDVSEGLTWGAVFRRDIASLTEGGTFFSIREAVNDQNVIFHLRLLSNGNISTVVWHRSRNDAPSTCTNAAVVNDQTWYAYRGRIDWGAMTHSIDRVYPVVGLEVTQSITPSVSPGAPDWSRMAAVVLDKAFTTSSGWFRGQFGALVLMKGVLEGSELAAFDARLSALAAEIDS